MPRDNGFWSSRGADRPGDLSLPANSFRSGQPAAWNRFSIPVQSCRAWSSMRSRNDSAWGLVRILSRYASRKPTPPYKAAKASECWRPAWRSLSRLGRHPRPVIVGPSADHGGPRGASLPNPTRPPPASTCLCAPRLTGATGVAVVSRSLRGCLPPNQEQPLSSWYRPGCDGGRVQPPIPALRHLHPLR